MDTSTGEIYDFSQMTLEQVEKLKKKLGNKLVEMKVAPTERQLLRTPPKVGRNEQCPCGSGLKFKKCCLTGGR